MIHDKVTDWFINRKMLFLERFISEHCVQGKSLDVGCNYGFFSEYLDKVGFNSHGIDVKQEYFPKDGKAHYSMQSAEKMNFEDESFEKIEPGSVIVAPKAINHLIENLSRNTMKWCFCFNPPVKIGTHTK